MDREEKIQTDSGALISALVRDMPDRTQVTLSADVFSTKKCILHWGINDSPHEPWRTPPQALWPPESRAFGSDAVQTPLAAGPGGTTLGFEKPGARWLNFVIFYPEEGRWDNHNGRNYRIWIPLQVPPAAEGPSGSCARMEREIIEKETGRQSWTLMHRFDLCHEFLDRTGGDATECLWLIFVWLRFSALRQLDWQRNYNTKPRELGHSMDRLTIKLADRFSGAPPEGRQAIRLAMTTLGRGGNAQRVRDEVLNIMHRHHIKEVAGHFLEEWHQKLHNNTTPDDIVICEAYLEFLRSGGDLSRFYSRLEEGGVTRERLESYERPLNTAPDFVPHLKDPLIADFGNFLHILKEVHAGADLEIAVMNARHLLDAGMSSRLDFLRGNQGRDDKNEKMLTALLEQAIEARRWLSRELSAPGPVHRVRDLLFLDIALEDFIRQRVEGSLGRLTPVQTAAATLAALENVCLTHGGPEFSLSLNFWRRLLENGGAQNGMELGVQWCMRAEAAVERLLRAIGGFSRHFHDTLQPIAARLGRQFHAAPWTVDLFAEEVLRGRPVFALSALLNALEPVLREKAGFGDWLVISGGADVGEVIAVEALGTVQGQDFLHPVVVAADSVAGDEEIPGGVVAIVTRALVDSLSHLAIRVRSSGVLFATCFSARKMEELKSFKGRRLKVEAHGSDVSFVEAGVEAGAEAEEEKAEAKKSARARPKNVPVPLVRHGFTSYAISVRDFTPRKVGYKSGNLKTVRDRLPSWIKMPPGAAIPFGVFDKALSEGANAQAAREYERLLQELAQGGPAKGFFASSAQNKELPRMKELILGLAPPEPLRGALEEVLAGAGLEKKLYSDWEGAWRCIKGVWASKWNERAYLSRAANGISHEDLVMSVLVQEVVKADYSFVIHTANPVSGDRGELLAQVVLGLGESLAANYPGRALDFSFKKEGKKEGGKAKTLSFPSKSVGLFSGGGLIFRSDSNGEDLEGYAGAGLYDSFVLPPPRKDALDYSGTPLVWDEGFSNRLLTGIAELGMAVEEAMGPPQDIEGAFSGGEYYIVQTRPQAGF